MQAKTSLKDFDWFQDLDADDLAKLSGAVKERSFSQGQLLFDREDNSNDVYFILTGRVLAVYWTSDGKEIVFSRIGMGSEFGELSALDGEPRSLSIYAQTATKALILPARDFLRILDANPSVRHQVYRSLVARIRALTERTHHQTTFSVSERVRAMLLRASLEANVFTEGGVLQDVPTHAEIGNTIGANREAVSRVLSAMTKAGEIESSRKQIKLLVPEALVTQAV